MLPNHGRRRLAQLLAATQTSQTSQAQADEGHGSGLRNELLVGINLHDQLADIAGVVGGVRATVNTVAEAGRQGAGTGK